MRQFCSELFAFVTHFLLLNGPTWMPQRFFPQHNILAELEKGTSKIDDILNMCFIIALCFLVPTPPAFFTKVMNATSVQVLWELPNKPGKVEGFRLSFRRVPHGDFQGPVQMSCDTNVHTLAHLGKFKKTYGKYGFTCVCTVDLIFDDYFKPNVCAAERFCK